MKNVVKLPKKAINLPKPGKRIATATQAAVTPPRAITLHTVFRCSDRMNEAGAEEGMGAMGNAPVVRMVKWLARSGSGSDAEESWSASASSAWG
jgi:hypothetical protein